MRTAPWRGASLGFPHRAIRGVLVAPRLSGVPGAPAWILGVCATPGGRAVTVVDLVALSGAGPGPRAPSVVVLVATPAGVLGIAADAEPSAAADADLLVDPVLLPDRIEAALCGPPPAPT